MIKRLFGIWIIIGSTVWLFFGCSAMREAMNEDIEARKEAKQNTAKPKPEKTDSVKTINKAPEAPVQPKQTPSAQAQPDSFIFDPMDYVDDGILVPSEAEEVKTLAVPPIPTKVTVTNIPTDTVTAVEQIEEASRLGFRVQIFASTGVDAARAVEGAAKGKFSEGVYLSYDPPTYKIRIGNCNSRAEAETLLRKALDLGYNDSWIVRDYITVKVKK